MTMNVEIETLDGSIATIALPETVEVEEAEEVVRRVVVEHHRELGRWQDDGGRS